VKTLSSSARGAGSALRNKAFAPIVLIIAFSLSACVDTYLGEGPASQVQHATGQDPGDIKYYKSDQPLKLGTQRYYEGNFGLAEKYFQDAVENTPKDVNAWIGLAASYDRLGRFDMSDRCYATAAKLTGQTPQLLNNEGYSYLLRGNLKMARVKFDAALRADPGNETALNNLKLLDGSTRYVERDNVADR
jgi:Flp pilus assembly protein TadD